MGIVYMRDENLIEGLKRRDNEAFEILIEEYGDRILKACYLILKDLQKAEDASQEVFLQIYKNIKKFKGKSSLYTWIYRITVNTCRNILRKKNEQFFSDEDFNLSSYDDVEDNVLKGIDRENIRDAVFSLKPFYREVVVLFYFEDLSVKEIGLVLNERENTVKSKLYRARGILRDTLLKEGISNGKR